MKHNKKNYYIANNYFDAKISYGFFTRKGGFSNKPFDSLNCNISSNDKKKNVTKNINSAKELLELEKTEIKFMHQIHRTDIVLVDDKNIYKKTIADGIITQKKNISLAILTADCAPIFIFDKKNNIICAIHSGWKGCLSNIVLKASNKIKEIIKTTKYTVAIVGPCLDQRSFEVDKDLKKKFIDKNHKYEKYFIQNNTNNKFLFNMRGLIDNQLRESKINTIFHVNKDTYAEKCLFFSHRRATQAGNLQTGRMINIIGFKQ